MENEHSKQAGHVPAPDSPSPDQHQSSKKKGGGAAWFTYFFGWLSGLIMFFATKDENTKFHAAQSIIFFGGLQIVQAIFGNAYGFGASLGFTGSLLDLVILVLWVVLMVKAQRREHFKLPLVGDLAEKMVRKK